MDSEPLDKQRKELARKIFSPEENLQIIQDENFGRCDALSRKYQSSLRCDYDARDALAKMRSELSSSAQ